MRIIVAEDDQDLCGTIRSFLIKKGMDAVGCYSAEEFFLAWDDQPADVVILDVNLPDKDGFFISRVLREKSPAVGIIMLTARGQVSDRIAGLKSGADNYLTKPLHLAELEVAVQNLYRRVRGAVGEAPPAVTETVGPWCFDPRGWALTVTCLGSFIQP